MYTYVISFSFTRPNYFILNQILALLRHMDFAITVQGQVRATNMERLCCSRDGGDTLDTRL